MPCTPSSQMSRSQWSDIGTSGSAPSTAQALLSWKPRGLMWCPTGVSSRSAVQCPGGRKWRNKISPSCNMRFLEFLIDLIGLTRRWALPTYDDRASGCVMFSMWCSGFFPVAQANPRIVCGLWLLMALCEHSCEPNCCLLHDGDDLWFITLRAIPVGSAITTSYLNVESLMSLWNLLSRVIF